jgi:hypothetical protein
MHYKDGTEAKAGDLVLNTQTYGGDGGQQIVGILSTGTANSTACNGGLQVVARRAKSSLGWGPWIPVVPTANDWSVTLSQCEKIESVPVAEPAPEAEPEKAAAPAA